MTDVTSEKQILPEVKALKEGWEAIDTELNKLRDHMYEAGISDEEYSKRSQEWREKNRDKWERKHALAKKISGETENKLVGFILDNYVEEYDWQSMLILEALPATLDELDNIAKDQGWCAVWSRGVNKAIAAGVIEITERQALERQLRSLMGYEMYREDVNTAMELVDKLVELRVTETLAERIEKALNAPAGVE